MSLFAIRVSPVLVISATALLGLAAAASSAQAKQVCGWYAIIFCSSDEAKAIEVVNKGWGAILETNKYTGLKRGLYCVASGPQPRASAMRDRKAAIAQGSPSTSYIKRACTDAKNVGD